MREYNSYPRHILEEKTGAPVRTDDSLLLNRRKRAAGILLLLFLLIISIFREIKQHTVQAMGEVRQMKEEKKKLALTFDDGPNPDYTEILLEGLKERDVKCTFFLLGAECEKYPELVQKINEEGHLIGVHSYEHVNLANLTDEAAIRQVDRTNEILYKLTGKHAEYIRPPYGCWKCNLDYETTMIEVLWDVDPLDWKTDNSDVIAKRVFEAVRENDIILLHDASESSVNAAFKIIDGLLAQDYTFVTVEELLLD